ncbi:MAG: hypothetical protein WC720_05100 [Candidatus Shapirobacteria bacterium]|jgi:hypothetical protein
MDDVKHCHKCTNAIPDRNDYTTFDCELMIRETVYDTIREDVGYEKTTEMHLCKDCSEKLIKLLKDNDYKLIETEEY